MIDSYDKLTIAKYKELTELQTDNEIDTVIEILSILTDISSEEISTLPIPEFKALVKKISFLKEKPNVPKRIPNSITINGKKYDIDTDAKNMSVGQYIDYKDYIKDQDSMIDNLNYILSVFLIPHGHKYNDGYNLDEVAEEIDKNLSITMALAISNFFFRKSEKFINAFLTYLLWKMRRTMRKEKDKELKMTMKKAIQETQELRDLLKDGYGLIMLSGSGKSMDALLTRYMNLT